MTLGEILIDMFPAEVGRPLTQVSAFHPKPGGAPANVAVAAHRLGANTAFIGKVGDDIFGHQLIDVLTNEGIEARVLDMHTIRPLDIEALAAAARDTGAMVTAVDIAAAAREAFRAKTQAKAG